MINMPVFPQLSIERRLQRLSCPTGPVRAVLDTDTFNEIDDQFAIVQALLSEDRITLEAIYAAPFFNSRAKSPADGMELSHAEILRLLERMDRNPEGLVHKGVGAYVGSSGGPVEAPAVHDLIARARESDPDDPLYVIAIAAISNIASALLLAPDIVDRIVVVWLGGHALHWPHTREYNLRQDIPGAQVLFDSGVPLVLVPCMGVTSHLLSSIPEIDLHVAPQGRIGAFLAQRFREYSKGEPVFSKEIWDMAPVAWLIDADWVATALVPTPILTTEGTWSVDPSRPVMRYATQMWRDRILGDFFTKLRAFAETAG